MQTPTQTIALSPQVQPRYRGCIRLALGGIALALVIVGSYWPSLQGGFVWDDLVLVKKNPMATGELSLSNVWFTGDFSLTTVATWIESQTFGENPLGYRIINVVLHCLSSFLVWRFLARLRIPGAWLGAALFAAHPVAAASVAWVSELKNTLSMPCFLLSAWTFWIFVDAEKGDTPVKARACYGLSLLTFLLALLAKTSTVMLPVVMLALIWWHTKKVRTRDWLQLGPHFGLALGFGLMTIWFQSQQAIRGVTVQTEDFWGRLAAAGQALWFYLGKALLPFNLCMIYPNWSAPSPRLLAFVPLLLWLTALTLLWRFRAGRGRHVLVSMGCFTVLLLPVLGLFDMYFMIFSRVSDHLAYLSLLAITPLVSAGISLFFDKRISTVIALVSIVTFMSLTRERASVFRSDEALWEDTIVKNPKAWCAHNNLACNLAERGEIASAIKHFRTSLELKPDNVDAHSNLGKALALQGQFAEAEPHFKSALELKPNDFDTLASYATGLAENHRSAEAIECLRRAISVKPVVQLRLQLAPLLAATGNYAAAAAEMQNIIDAQPNSFEALNNLAWIRATCPEPVVRNGPAAVQLAEKACRLSGNKEPVTFATLGAAYAEAGDFTNAVHAAQKAIDLARSSRNESFATVNQQLQRLYQSGRPFHTPPVGRQ